MHPAPSDTPVRRSSPWFSALLLAVLVGGVGGLVVWGLTGVPSGTPTTSELLSESESGSGGAGFGPSRIVVDTPQLRRAKERAGIEACAPGPAESAAEDGLPSLVLPCLGGGEAVDVGTLRGPMVINLWAEWCPPCARELPIYADFHDQHGDRVPVLGIDWSDPQPVAAIEMLEKYDATYPQLADTDLALGSALRVRAIPMLVMIDADGAITYSQGIEITSLEQLEDLVREHLGVAL